MIRLLVSIMLIAFAFTCQAMAQRTQPDVARPRQDRPEVEVRPARRPPPPPRRNPKGPTMAKDRSNGVLFVITNPPSAGILIKNKKGETVKQARAEDGEFRTELPGGNYLVEVNSSDLAPFSNWVALKPGGIRVVTADLAVNTGSIIIGLVETDAAIFVDGVQVKEWKKSENMVEIGDVLQGKHVLRITHPAIMPYEKEIEVQASSSTIVMPRFMPAAAVLAVKSNPGVAVYIDGEFLGNTSSEGILKISALRVGEHELKLWKDGYEEQRERLKVQPGASVIERDLKLKKIYAGFADFFMDGGSSWSLPKSWEVMSGKMLVRGPELGLVSNRVYKDFKLEFDISLRNGTGAVWVIRVRDENNYYVFQLSGQKATAPNTFRSYVCRDGKLQLLNTTKVVEDLSQPGDSFHIVVEAKGSEIRHFIETVSNPSDKGIHLLNVLVDSSISYGKVGFSTKENEEFIVYSFVAEPIIK
jgi:hypothetical protein